MPGRSSSSLHKNRPAPEIPVFRPSPDSIPTSASPRLLRCSERPCTHRLEKKSSRPRRSARASRLVARLGRELLLCLPVALVSFSLCSFDSLRFNEAYSLIQSMIPGLASPDSASAIFNYKTRLALSKVEHTTSERPCTLADGESCVQPLPQGERSHAPTS